MERVDRKGINRGALRDKDMERGEAHAFSARSTTGDRHGRRIGQCTRKWSLDVCDPAPG